MNKFVSYLKRIKEKSSFERSPSDYIVAYFFSGFGVVGGWVSIIVFFVLFIFMVVFGSGIGVILSVTGIVLSGIFTSISIAISEYLDADWW